MTEQQQATKIELENLMEKFKGHEDLIAPIQITYTIWIAEVMDPLVTAESEKIRAEFKTNNLTI